MKKYLIITLVVLAFAAGLYADKPVSYTLAALEMDDIDKWEIEMKPNGDINGVNVWYDVKERVGPGKGNSKEKDFISVTLTGAETAELEAWLTARLPGLNTQLGL